MTDPSPHQLDTLRIYRALVDLREDWGGRLVLCCGEGCASSGIPPAVSIAGGATLAVDSDANSLKSAMRSGELDFVVNTLDEALRALKNEIRQRHPLSVGLIADVDATLDELVERGVQPDLLLIAANQSAEPILANVSIRKLEATGMSLQPITGDLTGPSIAAQEQRRHVYLPASNAADLRALDDRILAILSPGDLVRRRWLQRLPKYLREARSGGRWIWLSAEEQRQLGA
jgi:urocanate hydratase